MIVTLSCFGLVFAMGYWLGTLRHVPVIIKAPAPQVQVQIVRPRWRGVRPTVSIHEQRTEEYVK